MGTIIFTLIFTSEPGDASSIHALSTWRDSILTYRNLEVLSTSLPIAARRTMRHWLVEYTSWNNPQVCGWNSSRTPEQQMSFLRDAERIYHDILFSILNAWNTFAAGDSEPPMYPIVEEIEDNFENLRP